MLTARRPQPSGETLRFMQRLWELAHALDVRSKRMLATIGVTGPQRLVIRMIGQVPRSNPSTIAATLNMHPSTLTGILARLEQRGLIERTADPADRRRYRFVLTAHGRRVDREKRGTVEAAVRRALGRAGRRITDAEEMLAILAHELLREEP